MKTKTVTLGAIAEAMRRNGYRKAQHAYIQEEEGGEIRACAIGQAALGLGVQSADLERALRGFDVPREHGQQKLADYIVEQNDRSALTVAEIGVLVGHLVAAIAQMPITLNDYDYRELGYRMEAGRWVC